MALDPASLIGFAFVAGVGTFFAPCAYPLLPGYVSYYLGTSAGSEEPAPNGGAAVDDGWLTRRVADGIGLVVPSAPARRLARAAVVGVVVSAGFFVVYGALAGAVVAVGSGPLGGISVLELVVGAALVVLGTAMAAGWKPRAPPVRLPERRRSVAGYFGFGVLYAAAAAGCTAPIFVGVAGVAISAGPVSSVAAFGAYAAGMSVLMIGVTVAAALGQDAILRLLAGRIDRIYRLAGALLVLAGLVQIYFFLFRFDGLELLV